MVSSRPLKAPPWSPLAPRKTPEPQEHLPELGAKPAARILLEGRPELGEAKTPGSAAQEALGAARAMTTREMQRRAIRVSAVPLEA